jgi:ABC-type branched-subunit amino acid transport system ATPase component
VLANLHVALRRSGLAGQLRAWNSPAERERAMEVLDFVGLRRLADEPAGGLSYGQQKLLEFAFIMIAKPSVMLLDESAGRVNPTLLRGLAGRIGELNADGITFVIVEHDMEFVMFWTPIWVRAGRHADHFQPVRRPRRR